MKLINFELKKGNHFIAMEYYRLIMNRTFLVLILDDCLIGLKINGLVSVEGGENEVASGVLDKFAIHGDLENPYLYAKEEFLKKLENLDVFGDEIVNIDPSNFKINRQKIKSVKHDKRKKWGMGYYPHDGKIYLCTENFRKKELIILGAQSGEEIKNWIEGI